MGDSFQIFAIIAVSIAFVGSVIHFIITEIVKSKSEMYRKLQLLNNRFKLKVELDKRKEIFVKAKNKKEYDVTNTDDILRSDIEINFDKYNQIITENENAYLHYKNYVGEYNKLRPSIIKNERRFKLSEFKLWIFNVYERYIFKVYKLRHYRYTKAYVKFSYASPQGKNTYSKSHLYSYDGLKKNFDEVKDHIKNRSTRQYLIRAERAKVNASLRYEVMKRDNFTCRLCGLSKKDGVSLHVDHIKPVSKGGKTTLDNLQTLCERCNYGKSDKYDEKN